jgi:hypothetical protein
MAPEEAAVEESAETGQETWAGAVAMTAVALSEAGLLGLGTRVATEGT